MRPLNAPQLLVEMETLLILLNELKIDEHILPHRSQFTTTDSEENREVTARLTSAADCRRYWLIAPP
jgi:hypothetical protein